MIVRKAYGAGLYAMAGPGFEPDACLALPTAKIAVMGPEAAVNAVYANKIAEITDEAERAAFVERLRKEYEIDIDILRLASELVVDGISSRDMYAASSSRASQPPRPRTRTSPTDGTGSRRCRAQSPNAGRASVGNVRRRTEEERAEAFLFSASDDGGGGFQARCASAPIKGAVFETAAAAHDAARHHDAQRVLAPRRAHVWH